MKTRTALALAATLCPFNSVAGVEALATFEVLSPQVALQLAQASMKACRDEGYQVAVAVVDRYGIIQVLLRDQLAGAHTPETATRKAWTAASFKTDTATIMKATEPGSGQSAARWITDALMFAGAVPVNAAGSLVGAVGVSGSPSGEADQGCAEKGVEAIEEALLF